MELIDILRCSIAILGMLSLNFAEREKTSFFP